MRKTVLILMVFICTGSIYSQNLKLSDLEIKKNERNINIIPTEKAETELFKPIMLLWPLNPSVVVENKKVYFALTKEISVMLPRVLGKVGFEYSYVFRADRNNHLRVFADYFYPIEAGDFAVVIFNIGGGYFTDTKKSGLFPQLSMSILAPMSDYFAINLYVKARQTFMLKKEESNIFDGSFGIGLVLLPW